MNCYVVWNSAAGQRMGNRDQAAMTADVLAGVLAEHGLAAEIGSTESDEHTDELVRRALADGHTTIVAAGGDGTVAKVAVRLIGTPAVLGILPLGSVMNIGRSLGIPRDLDEAAAMLARRQVRTIDVGLANGQHFFEAATVGISTTLFRAAEQAETGDVPSLLRSLWLAFRYRPARMQLRVDDRVIELRALMVAISNGPYMGFGLTVAPGARLDDGLFDVRIFGHFSKLELLRHLGQIMWGRRAYTPHVVTYRAAQVTVEARRRLLCRADGHELSTPLECTVLPAALRVVSGADDAHSA